MDSNTLSQLADALAEWQPNPRALANDFMAAHPHIAVSETRLTHLMATMFAVGQVHYFASPSSGAADATADEQQNNAANVSVLETLLA